ncbi:hypothetical protein D3C83_140930 [compost metagenome]
MDFDFLRFPLHRERVDLARGFAQLGGQGRNRGSIGERLPGEREAGHARGDVHAVAEYVFPVPDHPPEMKTHADRQLLSALHRRA